MKRNNGSNPRRDFLKTSGLLVAAGALAGSIVPKVHAAENNTIKIAGIGCGGRGRGAIKQALSTAGPTKLVALADAFDSQASKCGEFLKKELGDKVDVEGRVFSGLDSYKKAIDCLDPGDVVVMATPPAFRPFHFAYAVEKGVHIFCEKPVAVDAPGCKMMLEANKKALEKNLKIVVGLNNRHYFRTEETIKAIQDGAIGDIISCWVYRLQNEMGCAFDANKTPLQNQLTHHNGWTWLSGSFMVDWMIHNVDICCWARKEMWPVSVEGQGGRQVRTARDQMYDHCAYEYRFEDGVKMMVQLRQIPKVWNSFRAVIHGNKGAAVVGEGVVGPAIYKGYREVPENVIWKPKAEQCNSYQVEHDRLFAAIREDKPWNEVERGVKATFATIMARMAVDSGQELSYDTCWNSTYQMAKDVDKLTMDSPSPYMPKEDGSYELAVPGVTKQY